MPPPFPRPPGGAHARSLLIAVSRAGCRFVLSGKARRLSPMTVTVFSCVLMVMVMFCSLSSTQATLQRSLLKRKSTDLISHAPPRLTVDLCAMECCHVIRRPWNVRDTSSRTCVLPLAASKLYAENHVGRIHTQHGSPFARLRTRVLDRREKWTSFVSCSSRQPSHQHIVSGFQERDTIAAGTSSRGDPFACRARSAGLPLVTVEQTALVTAAGDPATRPSRRAAQATKG